MVVEANQIEVDKNKIEKIVNISKLSINVSQRISNLKDAIDATNNLGDKKTQTNSSPQNFNISPNARIITNKLYEDAIKRNEKLIKQEKDRSKSPRNNVEKKISKNSNNYLINRFNDDYTHALKKLKISKSTISYHKAEDIMKELGFISKNNQKDESEEKVLFVDLWGWIHGDSNR